MISREFNALSREAGIAAGLIGAGVTELGKAHSVQHALYNSAFFQLSIGLERLLKLVFVVDYAIDHGGRFPTDKALRSYGHDLSELIEKVRELDGKYRGRLRQFDIPDDGITSSIINCLSRFSMRSRYYNLDLLAGTRATDVDPLQMWRENVGEEILASHYSPKKRKAEEDKAQAFSQIIGEVAVIRHSKEDGSVMDSIGEAMLHSAETSVIQKWGQYYVLRLVRSIADLLHQEEFEAHSAGIKAVPYLHEFFVMFLNDDRYLKSRKTWPLYGR